MAQIGRQTAGKSYNKRNTDAANVANQSRDEMQQFTISVSSRALEAEIRPIAWKIWFRSAGSAMWHMKEKQRTGSHSKSANNNSMMESRMR